MTAPQAVGIDVGGTKATAVRATADGTVRARASVPTPADDVPSVLEAMRTVARAVIDPAVRAIGVGAAGLVEAGTGRMRFAPNIAWREVALVDELQTFDVPVVVDNDCTVAAFGEHAVGAGRGVDDLLYVGVGTGIGGGLVLDGQVRRGANGFAGEIGHIRVEPAGHQCGCGRRGCWETVASGSAITRLGRERLGADIDGAGVVVAARAGDATAAAILEEVGAQLGDGLAGLMNTFDPALVVVGGGAAIGAGELLLEPARRAAEAGIEGIGHRPEVPIVPAALGGDGAAIGAAVWALEGIS